MLGDKYNTPDYILLQNVNIQTCSALNLNFDTQMRLNLSFIASAIHDFFLNIPHYIKINFMRMGGILYHPGCKFTLQDAEVSAYFCCNKLFSVFIKTPFFKLKL